MKHFLKNASASIIVAVLFYVIYVYMFNLDFTVEGYVNLGKGCIMATIFFTANDLIKDFYKRRQKDEKRNT